MKKILFLSLGNICRSPMAEGILKSKLNKLNKEAIINSAGFESFNINEPPQPKAVEFAGKKNIDISKIRCRLFTKEDFDYYDDIYVMDSGSFRECQYFSRNEKDMEKVKYLMNVVSNKNQTIPNPNHFSKEIMEESFSMIDKACEEISKSS